LAINRVPATVVPRLKNRWGDMRVTELFVRATGVWLPPRVSVADAVASGALPADRPPRDKIVSVGVADGQAPPEMAAAAGRSALARSGCSPDDVALVLHAAVYHQGLDLWAPTSYVQREVLGNRCPAFEIRQMSNGGMAALELASSYLIADNDRSAALLTAADKFCLPAFDRWRCEAGIIFGDGASALVLSKQDGFARLRSVVTVGDGSLEAMHRGDDPFTDAPLAGGAPFAPDTRVRAYMKEAGLANSLARLSAGQDEAFERALADADAKFGDVDWFLLPHFGYARLHAGYFRRLPIESERTTWEWSRTVGHLGAADQFASLDHLATTGALRPGQLCLLVGIGSGFTWSCAVLEVLHTPRWDPTSP
jgi:3-oxoacyl-[acyl-carrier-protein] synthase-3